MSRRFSVKQWSAIGVVSILALSYVCDFLYLKIREAKPSVGEAFGTVVLPRVLAFPLKNGRMEYDLDADNPVATVTCDDSEEVLGVNDQAQLAWARRVLNERLLEGWMSSGVTIVDPASTWIDVGVVLEPGVHIDPNTQLEGSTTVATRARIGPGCLLRDTAVADGATVVNSVCESAVIGAGVTVGPFAHLSGGRH